MKYFILYSLLTISFNFQVKKQILNKNVFSQIDNKIIGEWGIYETNNTGVTAKCNVCPKIIFKNDKTAILTLPSHKTEEMNWTINGNILTIKSINNTTSNKTFRYENYKMYYVKKEKYIELKLEQLNKESFLILRH